MAHLVYIGCPKILATLNVYPDKQVVYMANLSEFENVPEDVNIQIYKLDSVSSIGYFETWQKVMYVIHKKT